MNEYLTGEGLRFSVMNFVEFKALIERAQKEARQLQETISRLENFDFAFKMQVDEEITQADAEIAPEEQGSPEEIAYERWYRKYLRDKRNDRITLAIAAIAAAIVTVIQIAALFMCPKPL